MSKFRHLAYNLGRPFGALKIAKFLSRHHPKILMYHRIREGADRSSLTAEQFREHVRIIKNEFQPMTLSDLLVAKGQGAIPKNAVVITFDDGYSDFAEKAFPILRDAKVPATLFVTTGFVNNDLWLWPDQIFYAITNSAKSLLKHSAFKQELNIKYDPNRTWSLIASHCLSVPNNRKLEIIDELFQELEVPFPRMAPEGYQAVSWDQIRRMVSEGLDVGSHSNSHPILTKVDREQLISELVESKKVLEKQIGKTIDIFCYPNGEKSDFNQNIKTVIEACGYQYAVCAYPERNPLRENMNINRYPASANIDNFQKNLFGLTFLTLR